MIVCFNFLDYFENPIVKFCYENNKRKLQSDISILTLDDCNNDIDKLRHSSIALKENRLSYVGDQLRLYYSMMYDDFLYLDADVFVSDFSEILNIKNCTELTTDSKGNRIINNGTFFHSNKDCNFNKYYFSLYEKNRITNLMPNYAVFQNFPLPFKNDMELIQFKGKHFLLSTFKRYKQMFGKRDTVYYSFNQVSSLCDKVVWQLKNCPSYMLCTFGNNNCVFYFDIVNDYIDESVMFELWKEQMIYTLGKNVKFVQID